MASDQQKTTLLFKEFTGVVNAQQNATFEAETYPFRPFVTNEEIFSSDISSNLADISYNVGSPTFPVYVYGIAALDASYGTAGATYFDASFVVAPNLVYYHKQELTNATGVDSRTWYVDPGDGTKRSLAADTIPFLYDPEYNSFKQQLYENGGASADAMGEGTLVWLMDYMSGFVEFYGEEAGVNAWVAANGPPRLSYIKYNGAKGASGGGGGGGSGGDASFNTVDISGAGILTRSKLSVTPYQMNSQSYIGFGRTFAIMNDQAYQTHTRINFNVAMRFVLFARLDTGESHRVEGYASYASEAEWNGGYPTSTFKNRRGRILVTDNIVKGANPIFDFIELLDGTVHNSAVPSDTYYGWLHARTTTAISYPAQFEVLNIDTYENDANVPYTESTFPNTDPNYYLPVYPDPSRIEWWNPLPYSNLHIATVPQSGDTRAKTSTLTTKTLMYDTADSSYFENLDASMANISELNASIGTITTLTATTATADDLIANDSFTIGTSVDPQIKWNTVKFYLSGFTPSPGVNDWVTIAQIGPDVNNTQAAMRGEAHFRVQDRLSGRHQCIDIFVTQEYSRGISLDAKVSGYSSSTPLPFKAVRIASGNTYEGGLLQLQVAVAGLTGSSNPYYLMLMDSTNNPGWQTVDNAASLNTDNNPTTYNSAYAGNLLNVFTTLPVDTTIMTTTNPTQNRFVGRSTTVPQYYQNARLQVHEEGIYAYADGITGAGNIQSIGGFIRVEEPINNDVLDISFDSVSGAGLITNVDSATDPLDIKIVASGGVDISGNNGNVSVHNAGNVLVEPTGELNVVAPGGINMRSDPGYIDISGVRVSVVADGGGAANDALLLGTESTGHNVNIRSANNLYLNSGFLASSGGTGNPAGTVYITGQGQVYIYGRRQAAAQNIPGVVLGSSNSLFKYCIDVVEPLRLWDTTLTNLTTAINSLDAAERYGQLAFATNTTNYSRAGLVQSLQQSPSTTADARIQSLMQCTTRGFCANLTARRLTSDTYSTVTGTGASFHYVAREADTVYSNGLVQGDTLRMYPEKETHDIWVNAITISPYEHYNHTPSTSGSGPHVVYFEVWIGIPGPTSGSFYPLNTSSANLDGKISGSSSWFDVGANWLDPNISADTSWHPVNNPTSTAVRVSRISVTVTGNSLYMPFTRSGANATPNNADLAPLVVSLQYPFRIPANTNWSVFVVERAGNTSTNVNLGASGLGYEKYGTTSLPAATQPDFAKLGITVNYTYNMAVL